MPKTRGKSTGGAATQEPPPIDVLVTLPAQYALSTQHIQWAAAEAIREASEIARDGDPNWVVPAAGQTLATSALSDDSRHVNLLFRHKVTVMRSGLFSRESRR